MAPGATDTTSLIAGLSTAAAGAQSGMATVALQSNSTPNGCTSNCILDLTPQTINVSGNVYRLANPTLNTTSVSLAARVGDATPSANVSVTNASPDQFTENLKASFETAPTGFTNTGNLGANGLVAQGVDSTSLKVGLASTATSGTIAGSSTIDFVTTGAGTDNAPDMSVGSKMVSLTGNVYQTAAAAATSSLSFGIVHVGDTVANQSVTVTNTATGALVDVITGGFGAAPAAPFTTSGDLGSGVAGNGGSSNALMVGLITGTAGVFNGSEALMLASHDSQLADVALTAGPVTLSAQVNNFASLSILQEGGQGALSGGGDNFTLDFGDVVQGTTAPEALLALFNDNPLAEQAFTDLLSTSASLVSGSGFDFNGCSAKDLLGGTSQGGCDVSFETGALGNFTQTLSFDVESSNSSGYDQVIGDVTLTLEGDIVSSGPAVPEPSTWAMMLTGFAGLGALGWRRTIKVRTAA